MFSSNPNYTKLKTHLRLAINRLKLLEKKKTELTQKARKEIAEYIAAGKSERAKIRVEHIIREDYMVEAMEIVEMYCDLILARFGLVTQMKELDEGLGEAISSLIWVAPRMHTDIQELKVISDLFTAKYGKPYADMCRSENLNTISEKLRHKMSVQSPPKILVEKYLIEIAKNYNVEYTPDEHVMREDEGRDALLIDIGGPPAPPGFIGYPLQMPNLPPTPNVTPFNYPTTPSGGKVGGFVANNPNYGGNPSNYGGPIHPGSYGGGTPQNYGGEPPQGYGGPSQGGYHVPPGVDSKTLSNSFLQTNLVRSRQERDTLLAARTARREARELEHHREEEEEDDFYDADDNRDGVLLEGRNSFEWRSMDTFCSRKEVFTPPRAGSVESHDDIYNAFRSFWPDNILQEIVLETNRYASEIVSTKFRSDWYETNIHEVLVLFSFWMMLGIIKMPTIKSCFSTNALLSTEVFRSMFSQHRYANLTRALHFANNSIKPPNASRLYCLGPILDHLNHAFQANFVPGPNVSIDESLTLWKGVLQFRQYIRTKAARFGIKTFELCDSVTGYLWSFIVYTGRDPNVRSTQSVLLKSTSLVLDLIRPLLHKGYCLYMDNWFNSPTLARYLKSKSTDCVGTLRATRCGVPALIQQADLRRGQLVARHCGDVVVQAWQDKRKVVTISTYHDASTAPVSNGRVTQFKPQVVIDYNKYMGGVDRKDQMLEPYLLERKRCKKWYMKLFKRLLNASILNSRILLESSSGRQQDHLACRLRLVQSIIDHHLHLTPTRTRYTSHSVETLARIDTRHQHWPVRISQSSAASDVGRHTRIRCVHCIKNGKKNIKTSYKCEFCDVPLCIDTCFKPFHNA